MAKLPEKIEDWTPPWKDGEFDEDKARGLIFNLSHNLEKAKEANRQTRKELSDAEAKVADFEAKAGSKPAEESAKDALITELKTKVAKLEKDGRPEDAKLIEKLEVALEVGGLSLRDAKRLVGDDRDELVEDATELAGRFAAAKGGGDDDDDDDSDGEPTSGPARRPVPTGGNLGNGRRRVGEEPKFVSVEEMLKGSAPPGNSRTFI